MRAIGRCAVSLENAAQRCIAVLLELIQTKVNYVVQEAVIVIKVRHTGHSQLRGCSDCCQGLHHIVDRPDILACDCDAAPS